MFDKKLRRAMQLSAAWGADGKLTEWLAIDYKEHTSELMRADIRCAQSPCGQHVHRVRKWW